ncbi:hypothetical protein [Chitinophaga deserti]|uniref:hypothetical protein n=1 Tax=Chitinophaga deserti TaxID=2164099 RepID=UPI0013008DB2|nr:hypothetical protein [Chitinophaga deserti]
MKRLVLAMLCLTLGAGAFAADSKTAKPADKKVEAKMTTNNDIVVSNKKMKESKFRIQRAILTQDLCGNHIVVWVSGPNNASWVSMYDTAVTYVVNHMDSNGCYVG